MKETDWSEGVTDMSEEKTKEKAKLTEWMAGEMGLVKTDITDQMYGNEKWIWCDKDGEEVYECLGYGYADEPFDPTEILEQAMEGLDILNGKDADNLVTLEYDAWNRTYNLREYEGKYLAIKIRLKDLASQIVTTLYGEREKK